MTGFLFFFFLFPTGLTSTSVRGCSSNEDVRTSKNKCQPTHLSVEQEILRQIVIR